MNLLENKWPVGSPSCHRPPCSCTTKPAVAAARSSAVSDGQPRAPLPERAESSAPPEAVLAGRKETRSHSQRLENARSFCTHTREDPEVLKGDPSRPLGPQPAGPKRRSQEKVSVCLSLTEPSGSCHSRCKSHPTFPLRRPQRCTSAASP